MAKKSRSRKTFLKFVEYVFLRVLFFILSFFSQTTNRKIFFNFLIWIDKVSKTARERALENLRPSFPEKSESELETLLISNYHHYSYLMADFLKSEDFFKSTAEKGFHYYPDEAKSREWFNGGGILVMGHQGNWEIHGIAITNLLQEGRELHVLAKRQSNPWMNELIEKTRGASNIHLIYTDESPRVALSLLKKGHLVTFIADQDAGKNGIFLEFLGRPASTYTGPAFFSKALPNIPIYFLWSYYDNNEELITCMEPMTKPDSSLPSQEYEIEFTKEWIKRLEKRIKEHPSSYFWVHRRWRTQPKELPHQGE
jgi:KDO2-lipid IV(A) lauroyltransferase